MTTAEKKGRNWTIINIVAILAFIITAITFHTTTLDKADARAESIVNTHSKESLELAHPEASKAFDKIDKDLDLIKKDNARIIKTLDSLSLVFRLKK